MDSLNADYPMNLRQKIEAIDDDDDDDDNDIVNDNNNHVRPAAPSPPTPRRLSPAMHHHQRRFLSQPWRRQTPDEIETPRSRARKCCRKTARYLFIFFNVVLLIFGGATLGASLWVRGQTAEFFEVERHESDMTALLETTLECSLAIGATFAGVALFGVVGLCSRQSLCLIVYVILTIVFVLCQLVPVCTFIGHSQFYGEKVRAWMLQTLDDHYIGNNPTGDYKNAYSFVFDAMSLMLECCGVNNGTDFSEYTDETWKENKLAELGFEFPYPLTCCRMTRGIEHFSGKYIFTAVNKRCLFEPTRDNSWKHIGCYQRIVQLIGDNKNLLVGVFVTFIVWQLVCAVLAMFQVWKIRSRRSTSRRLERAEVRRSKRHYDEIERKSFREEF